MKIVVVENVLNGIWCNFIYFGVIEILILDFFFVVVLDEVVMWVGIELILFIGYMGDFVRDIGNMVVYFVFDESVYVIGVEMVVDGGMMVGLFIWVVK